MSRSMSTVEMGKRRTVGGEAAGSRGSGGERKREVGRAGGSGGFTMRSTAVESSKSECEPWSALNDSLRSCTYLTNGIALDVLLKNVHFKHDYWQLCAHNPHAPYRLQ